MLRKIGALTVAVTIASGGTAVAGPLTVKLPEPTGPHRIGVTTLHLVDETRPDPWNPAVGSREVMTTVFYPARTVRDFPVAPQMTEKAAETFTWLDPLLHPGLPAQGVSWKDTLTHSHTGAPASPIRRPVLLYSPGFGDPRTLGTMLAEQLASEGYVVVTIDHPGDASEVELPDGRIRMLSELGGDPRTNPALFRKMMDTRFADSRFVLDELEALAAGGNPDAGGRALPENLGRSLDLRRVGMFGQGAGGATAAEAMYEDKRVDAAVNLEGYLDYLPEQAGQPGPLLPVAEHGVGRPLLMLGTDGFRDERFDRTWSAMQAHGNCTVQRRLDNASHWVLTDFGAMVPQLQMAGLMTAEQRASMIGAIEPSKSVPQIRKQVVAFFDRHVR